MCVPWGAISATLAEETNGWAPDRTDTHFHAHKAHIKLLLPLCKQHDTSTRTRQGATAARRGKPRPAAPSADATIRLPRLGQSRSALEARSGLCIGPAHISGGIASLAPRSSPNKGTMPREVAASRPAATVRRIRRC